MDRCIWLRSPTVAFDVPTRVGMDRRPERAPARRWLEFPTRVGMDRTVDRQPGPSYERSPHAWGWTGRPDHAKTRTVEVPTRVGMDRSRIERRQRRSTRSPRAWGWTGQRSGLAVGGARGPHARGDGPSIGRVTSRRLEVPTRVGMDRSVASWDDAIDRRGPHARGDGPGLKRLHVAAQARSPRAWGWTDQRVASRITATGSPHARGDGPARRPADGRADAEVPTRVGMDRGWPQAWRASTEVPTRVGMDRGCDDHGGV